MPRFPGFGLLYEVSDPVSSRPYRAHVDQIDLAVEMARAEPESSHPVRAVWGMGSAVPGPIIWTTSAHPLIVHERIVELFTTHGFRGWRCYPAEVCTKDGDWLSDYYVLGISGRCGPVDLNQSSIQLCEYPAGWVPHFKGHYFVADTWDGSDLFMHHADRTGKVTLNRFVTEPVMQALSRAKIRNLEMKSLPEVSVDVSVYSIGNAHLLPPDIDDRIAAAYAAAGVPRPSWV